MSIDGIHLAFHFYENMPFRTSYTFICCFRFQTVMILACLQSYAFDAAESWQTSTVCGFRDIVQLVFLGLRNAFQPTTYRTSVTVIYVSFRSSSPSPNSPLVLIVCVPGIPHLVFEICKSIYPTQPSHISPPPYQDR